MKLLNKLTDSSMLNEATDKKFVSDAEKTAISHSNRTILDNLGETAGKLTFNGTEVDSGGGGTVENLTLDTLTLGNYVLTHNASLDTLDFVYIG